MASQSRTGPPERYRRTPKHRARRQAARRSNTSNVEALQEEARSILEDLSAAGGRIEVRRCEDGAWRYKLTLTPGGDRAKCRTVLARANERGELQSAIKVLAFCSIAREALGLREAP